MQSFCLDLLKVKPGERTALVKACTKVVFLFVHAIYALRVEGYISFVKTLNFDNRAETRKKERYCIEKGGKQVVSALALAFQSQNTARRPILFVKMYRFSGYPSPNIS